MSAAAPLASRPYDPKHPIRPVPLWRQAEVLAFSKQQAMGMWSYVSHCHGDRNPQIVDPYKWIDMDAAHEDAAAVAGLLADLAGHAGEKPVLEALVAAARQARAGEPVVTITLSRADR